MDSGETVKSKKKYLAPGDGRRSSIPVGIVVAAAPG